MRRPLSVVILALAAACDCGGSSDSQPQPQVGDACDRQSDCGALLCFDGTCQTKLPASPACSTPGASPTLIAGAAVQATDPGAGVCPAGFRDFTLPPGQLQDLGEATVGSIVSFQVPPGTWSISIYEQEVGTTAPDSVVFQGFQVTNSAVPDDVKTPGGQLFFDDTPASIPNDSNGYPDYTAFTSVHFGSAQPATGTATFPNATKGLELARVGGELPSGTWTLMVNDWGYECTFLGSACTGGSTTSRYRVHVFTNGPPASTGRLDLDVYLATANGDGTPRVTAAQAAQSAALQRTFDGVSGLLGQAGICLGTVTFHDLPDWARLRFESTVSDDSTACDEVAQLFRLSQTGGAGVHFFLVDELLSAQSGTPGTTLLGIDGAVPGPSGLPGSPTSGAVAAVPSDIAACTGAFSPFGCTADLLAYVAAHESGHWLGLFHTTEATGSQFDPLADTLKCPCNKCAPLGDRSRCEDSQNPAVVYGGSCRGTSSTCGGAQNLMFWVIGDGTVGTLTNEQGEVIRLNPAVVGQE